MQTSIEYIIEQLASHMIGFNTKAHIINKIIEEAKEMYKAEQEILDEEIEELSKEYYRYMPDNKDRLLGFKEGMKFYREQLQSK
jgi:hypothetical protein